MTQDLRLRLALLTTIAMALAIVTTACDDSRDASGEMVAIIDWVDLVQINGIRYGPVVERGTGVVTVPPAERGQRYDQVRQRLSGNITDPLDKSQDGDASFLQRGTVLFEVRGYAPEFRIAAEQDGQLLLYEVDSNPNATVGSDLLDISGRVAFITVDSEVNSSELARIDDPDEVARLVSLVTAASVDHDPPPHTDLRRFVTFHLTDGTRASRVFWLETREMGRGIMTPPEFGAAIEAAVERRPTSDD